MNKKALDEKYFYQIDERNIVHLFRGEESCQQYLTNPLLSAIFKIEDLEKENAELKKSCQIQVDSAFQMIYEKDAEEIAKDIYIHHFDDDVNYPDVLKAITVGVQDGAEFGYNKANEWHYVKDELPPIKKEYNGRSELVLVLSKEKEMQYAQYVEKEKTWARGICEISFKPYAWKEIVLPELKESE